MTVWSKKNTEKWLGCKHNLTLLSPGPQNVAAAGRALAV